MKKSAKNKQPTKTAIKSATVTEKVGPAGASAEASEPIRPNLMERARQRAEASRKAALNKVIRQVPD